GRRANSPHYSYVISHDKPSHPLYISSSSRAKEPLMVFRFTSLFPILGLTVSLAAGEGATPLVPGDVTTAMNALPPEARPLRMMRAQNGAIYAKLLNG